MASYEQMLLKQSEANSAFNAEQAEINRDWQEYMSGSAHQREVKDLIAAGLNPVLSANSGASWSNVGNPNADSSGAQGLASLAMTAMNNQTQLEMAKISAEATKAAAASTAWATMQAASMNSAASMFGATESAKASRYGSDRSYAATTESASQKLSVGKLFDVSLTNGALNSALKAIKMNPADFGLPTIGTSNRIADSLKKLFK